MSSSRHVYDLVPGLSALSEQYGAVLDRDQLRALGVSATHISRQAAALRWQAVGERVVILHRGRLSRAEQVRCAWLDAGPLAAVCAWSTLEVAGLVRWERSDVHLLLPRGTRVRRRRGVVIHESRRYDPDSDVVDRPWFRTVRAARAAVDAASWTPRADTGVALVAAVVQQRVATARDIGAELLVAGQVRHRRHLLDHLGLVESGAESLAEVRVGRLLHVAGLPPPRRQVWVTLAGGRRRLDLEVDLPDGTVLVIEVDGPDHEDVRARAVDSVRDLGNVAQGKITVRITTWALRYRRLELIAGLRELSGRVVRT